MTARFPARCLAGMVRRMLARSVQPLPFLLSGCLAVALAACDGPTPPDAGVNLSRADAAHSTAEAAPSGAILANGQDAFTLTVVAKNAAGEPLRGKTVDVEISGTGHQLEASSANTDDSGTWTAGIRSMRAEHKTVRVWLSRGEEGELAFPELTLTFVAIPAVGLVFEQQPTTVAAGATFSPTVKVKLVDGAGATVPSSSRISIRLKDTATGATLSGTSTVDAVDGVATFSSLMLDRVGTGYILEATGAGFMVDSAPFQVIPGPAARFELSAPPDPARAGNVWNLGITARDALGNVATGYVGTVRFTSTDTKATLPTNYTFTAADQGVATFSDGLVLVTAGTQEVVATDVADSKIQGKRSTTVTPTWANTLVVGPSLPDGTVRAPLMSEVVVKFVDPYGNEGALTDRALSVGLTLLDGTTGAALGTLAKNATAGTTSTGFANVSVSQEGVFALRAEEVNVPSGKTAFLPGTSNAFNIVDDLAPGAPGSFAASVQSHESIQLTWTAPGDDALLGTASSYELRYATAAITSDAEFSAATPLVAASPATAGAAETLTISGLPADTTLYFAIRAVDGAGNASTLASTSAHTFPNGCAASNPCNAPPAPSCVGTVAHSYTATATCTPANQAPWYACGTYAPVEVDCAVTGGECVAGACVFPRAPVHGDLVITEIMHSPSAGTTEYIEVYNRSADRLDLAGLTLTVSGGAQPVSLPSSPRILEGRSYFVLGSAGDPTANGGVHVDFEYGNAFPLPATGFVDLSLGAGMSVFYMNYTSAFPQTPGRSMNLSSQTYQGFAYNRAWYWCDSTQPLPGNDLGTPGADNDACGIAVTGTVGYCVVQWPKTGDWAGINRTAPLSHVVYSEFWKTQVTDRNQSGWDGYPNLEGELGYGTSADTNTWTWLPVWYNTGHTGGNNDEFVGPLNIAAPGTYQYGYRYRLLDPLTQAPGNWVYCDDNGVVAGSPVWSQVTVEPPSP